MNVVLTNAAHTWGLDDISDAGPDLDRGTLLYQRSTARSADSMAIGETAGFVAAYSKGFTENLNLLKTGSDLFTVTGLTIARIDSGQVLLNLGANPPASGVRLSLVDESPVLFAGNDNFTGNDFNNVIQGFGGNDHIDGGAGTDTAVYQGTRAQYSVTRTGANSLTVSGNNEGSDTLVNVERIKFTDGTLAFDTDGTVGQVWRLYQAAFNRAPDAAGLATQVHALESGTTLTQIATNFIASGEFYARYGQLDNNAFVIRMYNNVLHRYPEPDGLAYHVINLSHGGTRPQELMAFAESPENQANLIGTMSQGMFYMG